MNYNKEMSFVYGADYGRRKTMYKLNGTVTSTKYYAFGNYEEELNTTSGIKKDYYIYGGTGITAAKNGGIYIREFNYIVRQSVQYNSMYNYFSYSTNIFGFYYNNYYK